MRLRSFPALAPVLTLLVALAGTTPEHRVAPMDASVARAPRSEETCWKESSHERALQRSIERERVSEGADPLVWDDQIAQVARLHAREMSEAGSVRALSSTTFDRLVTGWSLAGQNLGSAPTVSSVFAGFQTNADQAANLVAPDLTHAGVGVAESGGQLWVAVLFTGGGDASTTLGSPCLRIKHPEDLPHAAETTVVDSPYRERIAAEDVAYRAPAQKGSVLAVAGDVFLPVVLADFNDNPAEAGLHTPEAYESMLFQDEYPHGAGSMRDYYQDQSGGLLNINGTVTNWLRMPRSYSEYVGSSYGYQGTGTNSQALARDAIAAADPGVDFCRSDVDADGFVDSVFVVHAGPGAEETRNGLWSLRWSLPTPYTTEDTCANGQKVKVKNFTIEPEEYASAGYTAPGAPERLISIGMFVHEFGHELGLPDLYDVDGSSQGGVGPWDAMAAGAWGFTGNRPWRPVPMSAWSKVELGWALPVDVSQDSTNVSIPSIDAQRSGSFKGIYRLAPDGSPSATEYFLIENRERTRWAADFPGGGLAIWHVDASRRTADNQENAVDSNRLLTLVQADGRDDLGSGSGRGDAGDLFPGSSNKRAFNSLTNPSVTSYNPLATLLAVEGIPPAASTMTVDLYISANRSQAEAEPEPEPETSPSPTITTDETPTEPPPDDGADGPATVIPDTVDITYGWKLAGSARVLDAPDGNALVVRSQKRSGVHKLRYLAIGYVPPAARDAAVLTVDIAATRRATLTLDVFDYVERRWFSFGRVSIDESTPFRVQLGTADRWISAGGDVKLRFSGRASREFRYAIDSIQLAFNS